MEVSVRNALVRWLLLASVSVGVVVMHHVMADAESRPTAHAVATTPMAVPPMEQHPAPDRGPEHDLLHLCMAVILDGGATVIVLLLLIGVVVLMSVRRPRPGTAPVRTPARPPPGLAGRALLHSVCVARL